MNDMLGRVIRILVLLALVAPQGSMAQQFLYRCDMDGQVHRSCCCDAEACPSESPAGESCGCCTVEIADNPPTQPASAFKVPTVDSTQSIVALSPLPSTDFATGTPFLAQSRPPVPRAGPPRFLRFCSFLI